MVYLVRSALEKLFGRGFLLMFSDKPSSTQVQPALAMGCPLAGWSCAPPAGAPRPGPDGPPPVLAQSWPPTSRPGPARPQSWPRPGGGRRWCRWPGAPRGCRGPAVGQRQEATRARAGGCCSPPLSRPRLGLRPPLPAAPGLGRDGVMVRGGRRLQTHLVRQAVKLPNQPGPPLQALLRSRHLQSTLTFPPTCTSHSQSTVYLQHAPPNKYRFLIIHHHAG
jgi:hypothetical protein